MKKVVLGVIFSVGMFLPAAYSQGGCDGVTYVSDMEEAKAEYCANCSSGVATLIGVDGQIETMTQGRCLAGAA